MNLLRNILTAIWCAIIIGTNVFGLIMFARLFGVEGLQEPVMLLAASKMALLSAFGLIALISTKYLWAMLAVAVTATLLGLAHDLLVARNGEGPGLFSSLFVIIPTYLLARWNTAARKTDFNPVKEF
ncbi:hypothetical protein [Henriciella aquimarina]|uniref:hypothetical protein n=1 Tax=Henriciella aquimarina TaxID=545261 RepID=UPI0009FF864C|nr:hypothetical protein [Henriciella aquimarina]